MSLILLVGSSSSVATHSVWLLSMSETSRAVNEVAHIWSVVRILVKVCCLLWWLLRLLLLLLLSSKSLGLVRSGSLLARSVPGSCSWLSIHTHQRLVVPHELCDEVLSLTGVGSFNGLDEHLFDLLDHFLVDLVLGEVLFVVLYQLVDLLHLLRAQLLLLLLLLLLDVLKVCSTRSQEGLLIHFALVLLRALVLFLAVHALV